MPTPEREGDVLLEVRGLRTWFPIRKGIFSRVSGWVKALDGVSLVIRKGETLGVVGESGCGKSTLARTILRLAKPREGEVLLDGRDVLSFKGGDLQRFRRDVQVVFQDPLAALNPRFTILDILTEAPVVHGLCRRSERERFATKLLAEVGLSESALYRYPHEFSGGERQRICIARAIALKPRLLICDESVSALDVSIRKQVLELLAELKKAHDLSYLFITHDIGVVHHVADRVIVMHAGKIVEEGDVESVLGNPQNEYTKYLLASVPRIGKPL